jgi:hypothetical protein
MGVVRGDRVMAFLAEGGAIFRYAHVPRGCPQIVSVCLISGGLVVRVMTASAVKSCASLIPGRGMSGDLVLIVGVEGKSGGVILAEPFVCGDIRFVMHDVCFVGGTEYGVDPGMYPG